MKQKEKGFKVSEVVILLVITCVISLTTGFLFSTAIKKLKNSDIIFSDKSDDEELNEFINNYKYILNNYYDKVDKKELLNGALDGMLSALGDPYANYLNEETSDTFNKQLAGVYQGIGVEITEDSDSNIVIFNVFEDSPADKAGLKPGDVFKTINGENFLGKKGTDLTSYISSSKDSNFNMIVIRNGEEVEINLKRENVVIKSASGKIIESEGKNIGYIKVDVFAANTADQFKKVLNELESKKIDSLIIDLRDNTGGHLTTVEDMISQFLDSSHVIYQMQKKEKTTKYYSSGDTTKKYKIVLLGNKNTASASEVMIAALTEEYGAKLVGTTTYGKGTVQELINLSSNSEYKFTTKKWLTPKGNWINEVGIKPDIEVELSEDYKENPTEENDNQLQTAINELKK